MISAGKSNNSPKSDDASPSALFSSQQRKLPQRELSQQELSQRTTMLQHLLEAEKIQLKELTKLIEYGNDGGDLDKRRQLKAALIKIYQEQIDLMKALSQSSSSESQQAT